MGSHELYGVNKINQQQLREIQPFRVLGSARHFPWALTQR